MAYRQFQTAASRVVHLVQPTEADVKRLATEFHLHPLDLEAMLSISPKPRVSSYRHYVAASLPWPVMEGRRHSIMLSELQLFIGPNYLIVVDDGTMTTVRDTLATWESESDSQADSPSLLSYDLVLRLTKETGLAARQIPAVDWASAVHPLATVVDQLRKKLLDQGWITSEEDRSALSYLNYSMKHLADALDHQPVPVARPAAKKPLVQSAVTGYAVASAIMTALVLLFISFRR